MPRHSAHATHRVSRPIIAAPLAALLLMFVALVGLGTSASAGGWAIGSVDPMTQPTSGETVNVGFTILQHGVTPVDLDEDVGIELVLADGTTDFFPATGDGTVGHYVAAVTFPETSGDYSWNIHMGWFGPQDLGTIAVLGAAHSEGAGVSAWSVARWVMLALTIVLAAVAISDLTVTRRRARLTPT